MTRIIRTFALLFFFVALSSLNPRAAHASFGDCSDIHYLALFDARLATLPAGSFDCAASDPVMVTSDAGVSRIRIIQHLQADWATAPGAMRAIKDGVAAAAAAMPRLGHFRIHDVTIMLVDGFTPDTTVETAGQIAAWTSFEPGDECRITLWLLGPGATADYGASVISHELFHCVQVASLTPAQMTTGNVGVAGGGTWWIEGSASWFATLALPAADYTRDMVAGFDAQAPTTAINNMAYEAYVFFCWLGGAHGSNGVMPFLQQMASDTSVGAQRAAMSAALPADEWLHFAEAYVDGEIRDGQGTALPSTPQEASTTLTWSDTRTQRVNLAPFTITRRKLAFECGRWGIMPSPARFHAARPDGGAWGDLPDDLDNLAHDHGQFEFVGINAGASAVPLAIAGTLTARCQTCGDAATVSHDRCMIGAWQMTTDGAEQWMREHIRNFHLTGVSAVGNTLTLNRDGTFVTGSSQVHVTGAGGGVTGEGQLASHATGRWSTSGSNLNMCFDSGEAAGTATVHGDGHSATVPIAPTMPPISTNAYTCAGDTFTHTIPMGGHGSVTSTYNRMH